MLPDRHPLLLVQELCPTLGSIEPLVLEDPLSQLDLPTRNLPSLTRHAHGMEGKGHLATSQRLILHLEEEPVREEVFPIRQRNQIGLFVASAQAARHDVMDFEVRRRPWTQSGSLNEPVVGAPTVHSSALLAVWSAGWSI